MNPYQSPQTMKLKKSSDRYAPFYVTVFSLGMVVGGLVVFVLRVWL